MIDVVLGILIDPATEAPGNHFVEDGCVHTDCIQAVEVWLRVVTDVFDDYSKCASVGVGANVLGGSSELPGEERGGIVDELSGN